MSWIKFLVNFALENNVPRETIIKESNRSPFRGSGFRVYDFFIFLLLISVQARSANFKARMNSALDSKSKTLTTLTVELLTLNRE